MNNWSSIKDPKKNNNLSIKDLKCTKHKSILDKLMILGRPIIGTTPNKKNLKNQD